MTEQDNKQVNKVDFYKNFGVYLLIFLTILILIFALNKKFHLTEKFSMPGKIVKKEVKKNNKVNFNNKEEQKENIKSAIEDKNIESEQSKKDNDFCFLQDNIENKIEPIENFSEEAIDSYNSNKFNTDNTDSFYSESNEYTEDKSIKIIQEDFLIDLKEYRIYLKTMNRLITKFNQEKDYSYELKYIRSYKSPKRISLIIDLLDEYRAIMGNNDIEEVYLFNYKFLAKFFRITKKPERTKKKIELKEEISHRIEDLVEYMYSPELQEYFLEPMATTASDVQYN